MQVEYGPHVPCAGDSSGRQWRFAGAERQLGRRPAGAVGRIHRDDRSPVAGASGRDPALERVGEWQPYWKVAGIATADSRRGRREEEDSPDTEQSARNQSKQHTHKEARTG